MSYKLSLFGLLALMTTGCEPEADGETIWAEKCTVCHSTDAAGTASTPDIRQNLAEMSLDDIEDTILNGSAGGAMIQVAVSEAEAAAVASWAKENLGDASAGGDE